MTPQTQPLSDRPDLYTLGHLTLAGSDFERTKPLLLLCYLCLEGPKERRHLAELFWPAAADPLASLATELSRLKRYCGNVVEADTTHARPLLQTDAQAFLKALERNDLGGAASLYKGRFLSGVHLSGASNELEEWVYSTRDFLASRAADALLGLGEEAAKGGDFEGAARHAQKAHAHAAALEPEQLERAYALLVANGHPWAAKLREEALELGLPLEVDAGEARRKLRPAGNRADLPAHAPSFVGRGAEVREVADLLRGEARLVTVVGLAGMGKSRLAAEVVRTLQGEEAFPDGIHPVWLVALNSSEEVPTALANALGLELKGHDVLAQLVQQLADVHSLLLLDNYEHVIAGASFLSELLVRCPGIKILVTSRERLNLAEEWVYWLEGLPFKRGGEAGGPSEAAQLFVQRAKRVVVGFSPTPQDLEAAEEVGRRVEGSPLALELAASWTRVMLWGDVAAQLRKDQAVLRTTLRDVPERHRSIEAAFEYSWHFLSAEERRVLRELSVFRGGFSREAAREVVGAGLSVLVSLVDKSLLKLREGGRFGRHPLFYAFTCHKFLEYPELVQTKRRDHADYFQTFLKERTAQIRGERAEAALSEIAGELDNIRSAWNYWLEQNQFTELAESVHPLYRFFELTGRVREGVDLFSSTVQRLDSSPDSARTLGELHWALSWMLRHLGQADAALQAAERALVHFRTHGDPALIARGTGELARFLGDHAGEYERAIRLLQEAYDLLEQQDDRRFETALLYNLSLTRYYAGKYAAAEQPLGRAEDLDRQSGYQAGVITCLHLRGELLTVMGRLSEAELVLEEGLRLCETSNLPSFRPYLYDVLNKVKRKQGDAAKASEHITLATELAQDMDYQHMMSSLLLERAPRRPGVSGLRCGSRAPESVARPGSKKRPAYRNITHFSRLQRVPLSAGPLRSSA